MISFHFFKKETGEKPQIFIFLGRSGCGKGTQVELLKKYLAEKSKNEILHIESGTILREFIKGKTYTQKRLKDFIERGDLAPESMIICRWNQYLIDNFTGKENVIFDGAPRKLREAMILDDTLKFYGTDNYNVIYINVSRKWGTDRLLSRKRKDDNELAINNRMDWFDTEVMQAINFFKENKHAKFHDINGEQSIDDVSKELIKKVFGE